MVGDFFNEYLRDDYDALDGELNGTQWFQKQEEHAQQQMMQQNRPESEEGSESSLATETPIKAPTESPFRNTFDRKKQTESRKERLERIKQEYNVPYISVSSLQRRKRRKQQVERLMREQNEPEHLLGEDVKDGLAANTPGFTQLVEENEPTTTPLSSMGSKRQAQWEEGSKAEWEQDPDWWKGQESEDLEKKDPKESFYGNPQGKVVRLDNVIEAMIEYALTQWPHDLYEISEEYAEMGHEPIHSWQEAEDYPDLGWSLPFTNFINNFADSHAIAGDVYSSDLIDQDKNPLYDAWIKFQKEYPDVIAKSDAQIRELTKDIVKGKEQPDPPAKLLPELQAILDENAEIKDAPSSEELEKWLRESKNKHFCKKAISFENDPEAAEWFAQEKQRVEPKEDIEELAKEIDIEPEELKEWLKSAGGKRFCKRAIKR